MTSRAPVRHASRFLINQVCSTNNGGSFFNGLRGTTTLGCGSWGNNSISENLNWNYLFNKSRIAYVKPNSSMRYGIARSMNSNEAGQGSSPFIHGSADCEHPMRQGLWGAFEVFIDTIIVCSITALAVLCTGVWTTGTPGVTLTMMAYSANFGVWGKYFIGLMAFLFGITTTTGWYTYDCTNIRYLLRYHPIARDRLVNAWKFLFPIPNIVIVTSISLTGNGPDTFWAIVDISLAIPVFVNLLGLLIMRNKFFDIFKDYKARYMGKGKVDPDFALFYEEKPEVAAIAAETNEKIRLAKEAAYAKREAKRKNA